MNRTYGIVILAALALLTFAGCAAGPNELINSAGPHGETAGFWLGLWHGIIAPITFIISLFNAKVGVFDVHNNGGWYTFGFLLGVSMSFGGGGRGTKRASKRQRWGV